MFERFTADARAAVIHAQARARELGHEHIGAEHLLFALAAERAATGRVLRAHDVTPERVSDEIERILDRRGVFDDIDGDALTAIGVDLDAVRERVERTFGAAALRPSGSGRRRSLTGHLPLSVGAKQCLYNALREMRTRRNNSLGSEHLLLALLSDEGMPAQILGRIGADRDELRSEADALLAPGAA